MLDDCTLPSPSNGSAISRRLWKGTRVGRLDLSDREEELFPLPVVPLLLLLLPPPLLLLFEILIAVALEDVADEVDDPPRPPVLLLHLKSIGEKTRQTLRHKLLITQLVFHQLGHNVSLHTRPLLSTTITRDTKFLVQTYSVRDAITRERSSTNSYKEATVVQKGTD